VVSGSTTDDNRAQQGLLLTGFASDHEEPARQVLTARVTGQRKVGFVFGKMRRCIPNKARLIVTVTHVRSNTSPDARTAGMSKEVEVDTMWPLVSGSRHNSTERCQVPSDPRALKLCHRRPAYMGYYGRSVGIK
jgi:hypothetical protein